MRTWCHLLLLLFGLSACTGAEVSPAKGWVSLHPAITETLFELGLDHKLVGRSDYCSFPAEAHQLPSFGSALTPQLESLALVRPEQVFMDHSKAAKRDAIQRIAPITPLPWLTLDDVRVSTLTLGELGGVPEAAKTLTEQYQVHLGGEPGANAPTAAFLFGTSELTDNTVWYIKPDSLHGAALAASGFRNVVAKGTSGPPKMSLEHLIQFDPDVIIIAAIGENDAKLAHALSQVSPLTAVQNQQIHLIQDEQVLSTGPSIITLGKRLRDIRNRVSR